MKKSGKKYVEASKLVDKHTNYSIDEAIELAKKTAITKFDSSVEFRHLPKQALGLRQVYSRGDEL